MDREQRIVRRMLVIWCVLMVGALVAVVHARQSETLMLHQTKPTAEDELNLQIVILKSQLSQALAAQAKCEAEGPQSAKVAGEAQAAGQALIKALDARGLMIDQTTNKIVAKPAPKPVEAPKAADKP